MTEPWEYRWSSARAYALGTTDPLLTENVEYVGLAKDADRRQDLWRAFLLGADPREEAVRAGDWAIGDDEFRLRARLQQGRPAPRRRGRPRKAGSESGPICAQAN